MSPQQSERRAFISVARCVALTRNRVSRSNEPKANRRVCTGLRSHERSYEACTGTQKLATRKRVTIILAIASCLRLAVGSPSRGGDVTVFVKEINQSSLPTHFYSVLVSISVFLALSIVFPFINSPDNSPFSHSVLPVLSLPYLFFQLNISLRKSPSALI